MSNPGKIVNIAWVGNLFFQPHMAELGFDCRRIPLPRPAAHTWEDICEQTGFEPDMVIYADTSRPPPLVGLHRWPSLNVFYAIDTHIHAWYPFYAQAFDLACVSLKGHLWRFKVRLAEEQLLWLPPAAQDVHQPDWEADKRWDLLFAGNVKRDKSPKRWQYLHELGERVPGLEVRRGRFEELFPHARLSLNIAERGDLNFRVFEALACGACLITPRVAHGFPDLFEDGHHLFTYDTDDMDGLVRLVQGLLKNEKRMLKTAQAGYALVNQRHRFANRAESLATLARFVAGDELVRERLALADRIHLAYLKELLLHFASVYKEHELGERYLKAARDG